MASSERSEALRKLGPALVALLERARPGDRALCAEPGRWKTRFFLEHVEGHVDVSTWAKATGNLAPWQRGLAFSLGKLSSRGREPSRKQARRGLLLLEEARRLGYRTETGFR